MRRVAASANIYDHCKAGYEGLTTRLRGERVRPEDREKVAYICGLDLSQDDIFGKPTLGGLHLYPFFGRRLGCTHPKLGSVSV